MKYGITEERKWLDEASAQGAVSAGAPFSRSFPTLPGVHRSNRRFSPAGEVGVNQVGQRSGYLRGIALPATGNQEDAVVDECVGRHDVQLIDADTNEVTDKMRNQSEPPRLRASMVSPTKVPK